MASKTAEDCILEKQQATDIWLCIVFQLACFCSLVLNFNLQVFCLGYIFFSHFFLCSTWISKSKKQTNNQEETESRLFSDV